MFYPNKKGMNRPKKPSHTTVPLKVDVESWSSDVRPSFSGGGLEGEYLLHTIHLHWGEGECSFRPCLNIPRSDSELKVREMDQAKSGLTMIDLY